MAQFTKRKSLTWEKLNTRSKRPVVRLGAAIPKIRVMVCIPFFSLKSIVFSVALYRKKTSKLGLDGLPHTGDRIRSGDPLYCYFDHEKQAYIGCLLCLK